MAEINQTTTGGALARFYKDLLEGGIPQDISERAVLIATEALIRGEGELAVSSGVSA